jgi:hypothetical protein
MAYKYYNIVLSISNSRAAHERFRKKMEARSSYGQDVERVNTYMLKGIADLAGVSDELPRPSQWQEVWNELLEEFGYAISQPNPCSEIELPNSKGTCVLTPNTENEEEKMSVTTSTIHTVNGQNVTDMTADQLIKCVKDLEQEIVDLKAVSSESKYIDSKIKDLQATLKVVVKHLDSK